MAGNYFRPLLPADSVIPVEIGPALKPKACVNCRSRKVKCDRNLPCANCAAWSLDCVFPPPIRKCPRSKKRPTALDISVVGRDQQGLGERIEKMEKAIHDLSRLIGGHHAVVQVQASQCYGQPHEAMEILDIDYGRGEGLETEAGTLGDRIRGTNFSSIESKFNPEMITESDVQCPLEASHRMENGSQLPRLIQLNSIAISAAAPPHPSASQIHFCWQTYLENVDQLVKVVHKSSTEAMLKQAIIDASSLNESQESLLFAICFSSVPCMTDEDSMRCFGVSKAVALMTYRTATENALTRANFLTTSNLEAFQAGVLFLAFNRFTDQAKLVPELTALAGRLVDRFMNNPILFEKEILKRLWWQLWFLDQRAVESQGDMAIRANVISNSEPPLNVYDTDLNPKMTIVSAPRSGWTEISFFLVRLELARSSRKMDEGNMSLCRVEKIIEACSYKIQHTYLKYCNHEDPIHWLAQHMANGLMPEMRIKLHFQVTSSKSRQPTNQARQNQLFAAAVDLVDIIRRLQTDPQARRWKWAIGACLQFHPIAFLLSELGEQKDDGAADYALKTAEASFSRWSESKRNSKNGEFINQLMEKARATRQSAQLWPVKTSLSTHGSSKSPTEASRFPSTVMGDVSVSQANTLAPLSGTYLGSHALEQPLAIEETALFPNTYTADIISVPQDCLRGNYDDNAGDTPWNASFGF
ncbi:hypothetical protein AJ80_02138 [Polytolypa hystricis UAMH7299]|uniref:C6 finger domain transcription factor nscR n=1 Tax=Polytolypa hystricis (strain UAMH7299) TaxID=1447883 RepID=A0A2B7YS64_POLH7|nr:hypothetical protein AJ80_02138 [Polytolypa hystricis UAMH7299]